MTRSRDSKRNSRNAYDTCFVTTEIYTVSAPPPVERNITELLAFDNEHDIQLAVP